MAKDAADDAAFRIERTPLGWAVAVATPQGLCAVYLGDTPQALQKLVRQDFPVSSAAGPQHRLQVTLDAAFRCLSTSRPSPDLRLDLRGTAFQLAVWRALHKIPPGKTVSYQELAQRLGSPRATRAVAAACAANRIAVLIPCHRVIRGDGSLAGYRWGVARKRALLAAESASASSSRLKRSGSSKKAE